MNAIIEGAIGISSFVCVVLAGALLYVVLRLDTRQRENRTIRLLREDLRPKPRRSVGKLRPETRLATDTRAAFPAAVAGDRSDDRCRRRKTSATNLKVPGNVEINEQRLSYVQTRFPGWIQKVFANATYQYVRKGQPLFTIYSPDLVSTEQEYLLAQNQESFANPCTAPQRRRAIGCCRPPRNVCVSSAFRERRSRSSEKTGTVQHEIAIESPASGYITERNALAQSVRAAGDEALHHCRPLHGVGIRKCFQNDVGRLKPGDRAKVTVDAYPGRKFRGRIDQILAASGCSNAHRARAPGHRAIPGSP